MMKKIVFWLIGVMLLATRITSYNVCYTKLLRYLETLSTAPEVRFDIVSIVGHSGNFLIDHIEDAFNPS